MQLHTCKYAYFPSSKSKKKKRYTQFTEKSLEWDLFNLLEINYIIMAKK